VSKSIAPDGIATRYEYDDSEASRPTTVERASWRIEYRFDAQARLSRIVDAPGRAVELRYDTAGRLIGAVDAQGYKAEIKLDTEDAATVAGLYEPNQPKPLRATYSWYDEAHRLSRRLLPDGRIDTWRYDDQGRVAEHIDADGVLHVQRRADDTGASAQIEISPDGLLRAQLTRRLAAETQSVSPEDSVAVRRDDFGRTVLAWLPGQGMRQWTYDAANRMLQEVRLDRHAKLAAKVLVRRDAAGREIERDVTDAQGSIVQKHHLHYEGALLAEDSDNTQTLRYRYDEAARVSSTRIELKDEQGHVVYQTELGYDYDNQTSELRRRTLADGSTMRIERGAALVAQRMSVQGAFWSGVERMLRDWLPET
jgi:YD repeat-containing protein